MLLGFTLPAPAARAAVTAPSRTAPPAAASKPAADTPALTLVYGDDHVFGIIPPRGWTIDDEAGLGSKIRVVLYPKGETWQGAATVMYANPLHQKPKSRLTLRQMVEHDSEEFREKNPKGKVTTAPNITTSKGKLAEVRYFSHEGGAPDEAVAYIAEEDLVMLLVLSARTPEGFQKNLPAFNGVVASYQFVGGNIQTPR